ncbi:hypothetical protein CARUB_v10007392mg [Capsella rubella]|uniref:Uncharacterized protein n=1 Tax=Capsella rubella TaxID=81985 RepID=R0GGD4_9BRAS|nr:hypothetical protein CARUB_v10007392mg [Capsella rubella]
MVSSVLSIISPQTWLPSRLPISDSFVYKSRLVYCCSTSIRGSSVKRQSTARSRSFTETNRRTPSVQSKHEFWEDPDDGSDSDNEEEEDEDGVGNDLDYESDWEDDSRAQKLTATDNYAEELAREVEQLLEPEERAILQQNDKPNLKMISTKSWKPLQTLALSMQIQLMDNLIENGLDIDDVDKVCFETSRVVAKSVKQDNQTALHKAIIGKKEAVISHLLRKGANPHLQDREGWTPLHIAVQSRNRDITKILLTNGADKTRRTKDGKLALDLALCFGRDFKSYDLVKLLKIMPTGDI